MRANKCKQDTDTRCYTTALRGSMCRCYPCET